MTIAAFAPNLEIIDQDKGMVVFGLVTGTIPTDANKFRANCVLIKGDASNGQTGIYQNTGGTLTPVWTLIGSGGSGNLSSEVPSGTIDNSNVTFTATVTPVFIVVNGQTLTANNGYTLSSLTITLSNPVGVNGSIVSFHN